MLIKHYTNLDEINNTYEDYYEAYITGYNPSKTLRVIFIPVLIKNHNLILDKKKYFLENFQNFENFLKLSTHILSYYVSCLESIPSYEEHGTGNIYENSNKLNLIWFLENLCSLNRLGFQKVLYKKIFSDLNIESIYRIIEFKTNNPSKIINNKNLYKNSIYEAYCDGNKIFFTTNIHF